MAVHSTPLSSRRMRHYDLIARVIICASIGGSLWLGITQPGMPAAAANDEQSIVIVGATPTPPLPTPESAPAGELAAPTVAPTAATWLDAALGHVNDAAAGWSNDQAAQLAAEQAAQLAAEQAAQQQYLDNVGEQAPHCVRGCAEPAPPPSQTGPIQYRDPNGQPYIVEPAAPAPAAPAPAAEPAIAVAVPAITDAQKDVIGDRTSNGCAPGQIFYPRTGCHTPGSGGAMPGAVGEK